MAQKLLSVSIYTTSAKLSVISKSGKKISVYSCYDVQIPEGICEDGVILDVDALAQVLKHYITNYRIKTRKVIFSIASKRIASKEVVIPFVKEKQIKNIIKVNAPEYFPVSNIDDYVLNYSIIEIVKTETTAQYRMNVTATPNDLLRSYTELAEALKYDIYAVDYAGNAILQLLKYETVPGEICAILQLGFEHTVINLMNGPVQVMQRTVSTGLNTLISAVCENVGLNEEDAVAFLEDNDIGRIASAYPDVKYVLDNFTSSIIRIFDFYNGRSDAHPITLVKFIGDATFINGLGENLADGLGYHTEEIHTLSSVQVKSKTLTPEHATNFMANIGALVAPMGLKYEEKTEEKSDEEKAKSEKLPIWIIVLAVIASVLMVGGSFAMYYLSNTSMGRLTRQVEAIRPMRALEDELVETASKANAVTAFYESTKGPNDTIPKLIGDLETIMPDGMSIDTMAIDGGMVTITAGGTGKKAIARLITELKKLDYVNNVNVDYVTETNEDFEKYDIFTISFTIDAPPSADSAAEGEAAAEELPEGITEEDVTTAGDIEVATEGGM